MYFDAVVTESMEVLFNGTPEETVEWLRENPTDEKTRVVPGKTLRVLTVSEYLEK